MIKINKDAFTLSEVLITLAIVGVLAILVIPGLVKDTNNKAMMSLLQGTISNLNNITQVEIATKGARNIQDTDIYNNPTKFLNNLEVKKEGNAFSTSYRSINGGNKGGVGGTQVLLKNGVAVAIINKYYGLNSSLIAIDLNGTKEPNIVGVDYFTVELQWDNDETKGTHLGDIGGYQERGAAHSNDRARLRTSCLNGESDDCYSLAELSGFDPNYLKED